MKLCACILKGLIGYTSMSAEAITLSSLGFYTLPRYIYLSHQKSLHRYPRIEIENMKALHYAK